MPPLLATLFPLGGVGSLVISVLTLSWAVGIIVAAVIVAVPLVWACWISSKMAAWYQSKHLNNAIRTQTPMPRITRGSTLAAILVLELLAMFACAYFVGVPLLRVVVTALPMLDGRGTD